MKLNPKKCKEMYINFMKNSVTALRPIMPKEILKVYLFNVRSVLEYAAQVWQDIPAYLSGAIESIQRRALRIIFPDSSYQQALPNLTSLANRKIPLCKKVMTDMRNKSHPICSLVPQVTTRTIPYHLRSGSAKVPKQ